MEKEEWLKLTFLGTSAGKPTTERNVSALGLEFEQDNKWYLFDCGEATQHQIMRSSLRVGRLNTIFITHLHGDHYYGLLGLLSSKKLDKAFNPLTIYGPKGIRKFIECAFADLSFEHLKYHLKIIEYEAGERLVFDRFTLKILPLVHSVESVAFYIKENDTSNRLNEEKLRAEGLEPSPLYGELKKGRSIVFEGKEFKPEVFMLEPVRGRSLIIAGDNSQPDILGSYLDDLDLLVHECTYTQDVYDNLPEKVLHTTAKDLGEAAEEKHLRNLIATHINPRYSSHSRLDVKDVYDEIKERYSGRLFIANDLDVYRVGRNGIVEKL